MGSTTDHQQSITTCIVQSGTNNSISHQLCILQVIEQERLSDMCRLNMWSMVLLIMRSVPCFVWTLVSIVVVAQAVLGFGFRLDRNDYNTQKHVDTLWSQDTSKYESKYMFNFVCGLYMYMYSLASRLLNTHWLYLLTNCEQLRAWPGLSL